MMERLELLEKLEIVSPALSSNDLIPVLTHFWFTGSHVMAYNDVIGISTPCETDFSGAVPGKILVELLKASAAKKIELREEKGVLHVVASRSKMKLGLRPASDFVFEMPEPENNGMPISGSKEPIIIAIEDCMRSVSTDTAHPDQLGITIIPSKGALDLYSTNNDSLTHVALDAPHVKNPGLGRLILSGTFCREMLKLVEGAESEMLEIKKDRALFVSGDTLLHGRLIDSRHPFDFEDVIAEHVTDDVLDSMIDIPKELQGIMDRAVIIADASASERVPTSVTYEDGKLFFDSRSDRGHVRDYVACEHADVKTDVSSRLFKAALPSFDKIVFTERCALLTKEGATYIISAAVR